MCVYFSELSFGLVFSTLVAKLPINRCIWAQPENLQVKIELSICKRIFGETVFKFGRFYQTLAVINDRVT